MGKYISAQFFKKVKSVEAYYAVKFLWCYTRIFLLFKISIFIWSSSGLATSPNSPSEAESNPLIIQ